MKAKRKDAQHREISDKELNEITTAFGNQVRAESIEVNQKIQESLQIEFNAMRSRAAQILRGKKAC